MLPDQNENTNATNGSIHGLISANANVTDVLSDDVLLYGKPKTLMFLHKFGAGEILRIHITDQMGFPDE